MLDARSPYRFHFAQNASLVALSLLLLPFSTLLLFASVVARPFLSNEDAARKRIRRSASGGNSSFRPKTIIVTGVGMTKGLFLARAFYKAGHNVIGADFEPNGIPVCGRFSKAVRTFYSLPKPNEKSGAAYYIDALLHIVRKEKVDLWVSCSGVASAVEDGQAKEVLERRSDVRCIQFDVLTTQMLHEKDTFIAQTQRIGLPTPETHNVTSRAAVHRVLHESPKTKKQYIMKSVGMDDASRGDMTVLPKRTVSETYNHVSAIPISGKKPWVLQQFIKGREYCTHALIVNNEVKAFVACPSSELLMHYEALPSDSALSCAMLRFTEEFVQRSGSNMTGHLSFDVLVEEVVSEKGAQLALLPIECNPRAHTAVVLFQGQEKAMSEAYLTALTPQINGTSERPLTNGSPDAQPDTYAPVTPTKIRPNINGYTRSRPESSAPVTPANPARYYWLGHDLVTLLLLPLLSLLSGHITISAYLHGCRTFLEHVLLWRDGTFELWDPLPAWWLYHGYWPGQFLAALVERRKWSRVNVSTCKIFGC
ncbi:hypothetical protein HO173_012300 [Letharia columbiana]|uniref:ATP-grasp domain-containing protein n=1 Tax=Letharia columbiana TaxID=112416 RepID=A0A8H6CP50_9LECA|nr:uncharacterized protein HO173_012300 [Letharia columbiana]KAF6226796.1 hypothetical protein HO173_012300 [Letharia columbiana]